MSDIQIPDPEHPHGRFRRFLRWVRDYDSDRAREYYSKAGVWSSRVYTVLLPMLVMLVAWADPSLGVTLYIGMAWGLVSRIYLWYQAKAILAYPTIEEQHANRDQINSFAPLISIIILIVVWVVIEVLYYSQIIPKSLNYTALGWFMIIVAFVDVFYDLRINNRVMFILAGIPPRLEHRQAAPPHD